MFLSSTKPKQKLKRVNPQKCAEFLQSQKIKVKQLKDRRKEKRKNELYTPELVKQYETQKELSRLPVRNYRSKGDSEKMTQTSKSDLTKSNQSRDVTDKEQKVHIRRLQPEYRAQQSEEKKEATRERDRENRKAKHTGLIEGVLEEVTNIKMEDVESNFTQELKNVIKQEIQEMGEVISSTPLSEAEQQNTERKNVDCAGFFFNIGVEKKPSRSTKQRHIMKALNPQKYAEFLERQRIGSKKRRERRKEKWKNGSVTWELVQQYERQKELTRLRVRKHRSKVAPEKMKENTKTYKPESKRPRDMTKNEKREHTRTIQQEYRARQSEEKKQEIREKDRAYRKVKRAGLIKVKIPKTTEKEP